MRFGQLKKQMPAKVLTERLRMPEEAGIVLRVQEAIIPPYSFTKRVHQLEKLLDEINTLAVQWSGGTKYDEEKCMLDKKLK
jgi:DNA-binding HxlR family transcriptional regulator